MSDLWLPPSARKNATLGKETLVYFERLVDGHVLIPPVTHAPTPKGYVRMEADTAKKLEQVSRRFEAQKKREFAQVDEKHAVKLFAKMKEIRGRLITRMHVTKSQFEKDFIRVSLKRLEDDEAAIRFRRVEGCLAIEAQEARRG